MDRAQQPPERAAIGSYSLLEVLDRDGTGVAYRARHEPGGQVVALRTLQVARAGLLPGIRREIQALAQLRHPGVVRILDEGSHEGMPWYATELVEGSTLRSHMQGAPAKARARGPQAGGQPAPGEPVDASQAGAQGERALATGVAIPP